jgi:uncharacterized membrane protein
MMIEILSGFYASHYNFGIIAVLMLLLAAFLGSKKNLKGVVVVLSIFLVYNLVLYNKTKREPNWYDKKEAEVKDFDPVKKLWDDKPADDDADKRK